MKRIAFVLFLAACSSHAKTSETSSPSGSTPITDPTPATGSGSAAADTGSANTGSANAGSAETGSAGSGAAPVTARGEKCGEKDSCPAGLECVKYYGIAGPRGPQFSSCETKCDGGKACPAGTKCTTIADGPGAVCR